MCVEDLLHSFFFQAEDGIRDATVTGVQTCALPIYAVGGHAQGPSFVPSALRVPTYRIVTLGCKLNQADSSALEARSEERRVGKECRWRWWSSDQRKRTTGVAGAYGS